MIKLITKNKKTFLIILSIYAFFSLSDLALAQVTQTTTEKIANSLIINWQANNFAPSTYQGKLLPTNGSIVSLSILGKIGNKIMDLSDALIMWYLDEEFLTGGLGQTDIQFKVTKTANNFYLIKVNVTLPQQNGSSQFFSQGVRIPIANPQTVINVPYASIQSNTPVFISAVPYFFNIQSINDLSFDWEIITPIETQKVKGDNKIIINTNEYLKGKPINISLKTQNTKSLFEFSKSQITIYVQ